MLCSEATKPKPRSELFSLGCGLSKVGSLWASRCSSSQCMWVCIYVRYQYGENQKPETGSWKLEVGNWKLEIEQPYTDT
jgi:hypothetical protein